MGKNSVIPDILLFYWHGSDIPKWRMDNHARLVTLYPKATVIRDEGLEIIKVRSDLWRLLMCSRFVRCLWVDNDIELDGPLDLTERPALADEYNCGHISIVWSGDDPKVFDNLDVSINYNNTLLQDRVKNGLIDKIKINGTHWATTATGDKVKR